MWNMYSLHGFQFHVHIIIFVFQILLIIYHSAVFVWQLSAISDLRSLWGPFRCPFSSRGPFHFCVPVNPEIVTVSQQKQSQDLVTYWFMGIYYVHLMFLRLWQAKMPVSTFKRQTWCLRVPPGRPAASDELYYRCRPEQVPVLWVLW